MSEASRDEVQVTRIPEGVMGQKLEPPTAWPGNKRASKPPGIAAVGPELCTACGGPVQVRKVGRGGLYNKRWCLEGRVWEAKCPGRGPQVPVRPVEVLPARREPRAVQVAHLDEPVSLDLAEAMRKLDYVKVQTDGPREFLRRLERAADRWERILGLSPLEE